MPSVEYNAEYYRENSEKEKARVKAYHEENRSVRLDYMRNYARSLKGLF